MKSIKEKAENIQLGYDDIQAPAIGRGFVLGANYVLDEIEKLLPKDGKPLNDTGKVLLWRIKDTIEQLKGGLSK